MLQILQDMFKNTSLLVNTTPHTILLEKEPDITFSTVNTNILPIYAYNYAPHHIVTNNHV